MTFNRDIKQAATGRTTFSAIVGSAAFRIGMEDYAQGLPPRDALNSRVQGAIWNYERGRLYAATCAGQSIATLPARVGRAVNRSLIHQVSQMYRAKEVL